MSSTPARFDSAYRDWVAPLGDGLPLSTVITSTATNHPGEITVQGSSSDSGVVKRVTVNGEEVRPVRPNFAEWEVVLTVPEGGLELSAFAMDAAENVEPRPHRIRATAP